MPENSYPELKQRSGGSNVHLVIYPKSSVENKSNKSNDLKRFEIKILKINLSFIKIDVFPWKPLTPF